MYQFTDRQKAAMFDAGVMRGDVITYHAMDDHAWQSTDEAFECIMNWWGDAGFDHEAHDRAVAEDDALQSTQALWSEVNAPIEHPNVRASCYEECY